jgi:hypothetical protein
MNELKVAFYMGKKQGNQTKNKEKRMKKAHLSVHILHKYPKWKLYI